MTPRFGLEQLREMERQQTKQERRNRCEGWWGLALGRDQERQLLQIQKEIPIGRWVSRNLTWKYKADNQYGSQGGEERGVSHPDTG